MAPMAKEGDSDGSGSEEYEWADLPRTSLFPLLTNYLTSQSNQARLSVYFQGVKERINVEEQRNHQLAKPTRRDRLCMHTILHRILLDLIL